MHSLAIEATGLLVVATRGSSVFALVDPGGVSRVDPSTGNCVAITAGRGGDEITPQGIAVEATGNLVILDPLSASVVLLDLVTENRTIVADLVVGRGPLLSSLGPLAVIGVGMIPPPIALHFNDGIAVEATGNLIVADPSLDAILRIDTISGDRAIISR